MGLQHTPTGTRGCATQPAPIEQRRFRDVPAVVLAAFALGSVLARARDGPRFRRCCPQRLGAVGRDCPV